MGLSLSVLVALCLFLPGAAFVFGLTRLHSPTSPGTPLDQHLSIGLGIAVGAGLIFNGAWLALWVGLISHTSLPLPDSKQLFALLGGDLKSTNAIAALASIQAYPLRISAYFVSLALICWYLGKQANRSILRKPVASWFDLLKPQDGVEFVWLTADMHLDGHCYLFAGPVHEFSVAKDGSLERVVLGYAVRRPMNISTNEEGFKLDNGWIEIPGEFVVLLMGDVRTVNLDYIFPDPDPAPDSNSM